MTRHAPECPRCYQQHAVHGHNGKTEVVWL